MVVDFPAPLGAEKSDYLAGRDGEKTRPEWRRSARYETCFECRSPRSWEWGLRIPWSNRSINFRSKNDKCTTDFCRRG
jgi:hypothetical protein